MSNAARVARNTVANWTGTACNVLVVFFLTPYVLDALGKEAFGVYLIAQQVLVYVGLLVVSMQPVVSRFVARSIAAEDLGGLNATVSTMSLFFVGMGLIGILICGGLGLFAPRFFDISADYARDTSILFLVLGSSFLLDQLAFIHNSVLVGHQRFDLLNLGVCIRELGRAGLVVVFFSLGFRSLSGFAAALFVAGSLALAYSRFAGHHQQPGLNIRLRHYASNIAREVLGFGFWNILVQVGNVVTFATPPLIVAKALGTDQVVFFSIPLMLAERLRILVAGMAFTLAPLAASTLVTGDRDHFRALITKGTLAAATFSFPIGAILLVFCKPFLSLWMGPAFAWSWVVYAVLMIAMFGRISQAPTLHVLVGGGQVRGLAYIQAGSAVLTVVLSILLVMQTSWGVVAVAIGMTVPLFFSHSIGLPWYAAKQMAVPLRTYYVRAYAGPIASALLGFGVALFLSRVWPPSSWVLLIAEFAVSLAASALLAWRVCLDSAMRQRVSAKLGLSG